MQEFMEKFDKTIKTEKHASFVEAVREIGEFICEKSGLDYEILGPFGLRCEIALWIVDKTQSRKDLNSYVRYSIVITPHNIDDVWCLYYDTGDIDTSFPKGSIGFMNGFDNIVKKLPKTLDEVWELMQKLEKERSQEVQK